MEFDNAVMLIIAVLIILLTMGAFVYTSSIDSITNNLTDFNDTNDGDDNSSDIKYNHTSGPSDNKNPGSGSSSSSSSSSSSGGSSSGGSSSGGSSSGGSSSGGSSSGGSSSGGSTPAPAPEDIVDPE